MSCDATQWEISDGIHLSPHATCKVIDVGLSQGRVSIGLKAVYCKGRVRLEY